MLKMINTPLTEHRDSNPGAPGKGSGPKHPSGPHDDLQLPNGSVVGQTGTEVLRGMFARLGIEDAHTAGRHIIVQRYHAMLRKVHDDAGAKAVDAWLAQHRG